MKKSLQAKVTEQPDECLHCGLNIPALRAHSAAEEVRFCCRGCECVYQLLQGLGLKEFYNIKESVGSDTKQAALTTGAKYLHFDDPEFQKRHLREQREESRRIDLYVEGIHCAACVWLLERLPDILPGIDESRVHFETSSLRICYRADKVRLSEIAASIDSLGYKPVAKTGQSADELNRRQRRDILLRLAVAAVSAGNTMMIAISLYQGWFSGMEQSYVKFFHWVSLIVSLPAVLYSAQPFYRAAFGGLRVGALHIDLPISIGIIAGFLASAFNTVVGAQHVYFDSICMLVFLLLLGRWLQRVTLDHALASKALIHTLLPLDAIRMEGKKEVPVYSGSLLVGQIVRVVENSAVPVDGELISGRSFVDTSVLTGESRPQRVVRGDKVYAGTRNVGEAFDLLVEKSGENTRLGTLLSTLDGIAQKKPRIVQETDKVASWFVAIVVCLAICTAGYWFWSSGLFVAIDRTLALLVVSCPCALGLAAPISLSIAQKKAANMGIFIRSAEALERVAAVTHLCLDKTGTVTSGIPTVVSTLYHSELSELQKREALTSAAALEQGVSHPFASAIREIASCQDRRFQSLRNQLGKGVSGVDENNAMWRLGSKRFLVSQGVGVGKEFESFQTDNEQNAVSTVFLSKDDTVQLAFAIGDPLKPHAAQVIRHLIGWKYEMSILSGDSQGVVDAVAKQLGIRSSQVFGELSPEDKVSRVEKAQSSSATMMLGDGANDAAAFAAASVGVAVHGGAEVSLRTADVFIADPDFLRIQDLFALSARTLSVIRRNLLFSAVYNVVGAALAILGVITPLLAAILMPISSLTVIVSSGSLMRKEKDIKSEKV